MSCQAVAEGKMIRVMMEWGRHQGQCNRFPGICLRTRKTPVRKPLGALSSMTSHCFKWYPFPPNEVSRATLPALLQKPIGPSQKSMLKNLRSKDPESTPLGHSSNIQLLRAYPPKRSHIAESFYFISCLSTLICTSYDTSQLSEVSATLLYLLT